MSARDYTYVQVCVFPDACVSPKNKTKENKKKEMMKQGKLNWRGTVTAVCLYTGPCPSGWEVFISKYSRISHW